MEFIFLSKKREIYKAVLICKDILPSPPNGFNSAALIPQYNKKWVKYICGLIHGDAWQL